jgi:hypothetical protein
MSTSLQKRIRRFEEGRTDGVKLGGYNGTVHVEVVREQVRVRVATTNRQRIVGPDLKEVRTEAVRVARECLEELRSGEREQRPQPRPRPQRQRQAIVVRDVWRRWLEVRALVPPEALAWRRRRLLTHFEKQTKATRHKRPSFDSVNNVLQAARRLDRHGVLRFEAPLEAISTGTLERYVSERLDSGASPDTLKADLGRFRTAVRYFRKKWPSEWGDRHDPTDGLDRIETPRKEGEGAEIGEGKAPTLLRTLLELGRWRAYAAAVIAYHTGRRIGAIGGMRIGLHLNGPPLCASDFRVLPDGTATVTWRTAAAKGAGYGSGDREQPCSQELSDLVSWLQQKHPNPLGPDHPLIWSPRNPRSAVSYEALTGALAKAWEQAFGEPKPKGLGWHGFVRTTVTTIADQFGTLAAAEVTGRSERVVLSRYKVRRQAHQKAVIEEIAEQRRKAASQAGNGVSGP